LETEKITAESQMLFLKISQSWSPGEATKRKHQNRLSTNFPMSNHSEWFLQDT